MNYEQIACQLNARLYNPQLKCVQIYWILKEGKEMGTHKPLNIKDAIKQ